MRPATATSPRTRYPQCPAVAPKSIRVAICIRICICVRIGVCVAVSARSLHALMRLLIVRNDVIKGEIRRPLHMPVALVVIAIARFEHRLAKIRGIFDGGVLRQEYDWLKIVMFPVLNVAARRIRVCDCCNFAA
jgi:hypothetical protein